MNISNNTNNNLSDFIKNSELTEVEKSFWIKKAEIVSDKEKEAYLALFKYYPDDIKWVAKTSVEAEKALNNKNFEEFNEIKNKINKKLQDLLDQC